MKYPIHWHIKSFIRAIYMLIRYGEKETNKRLNKEMYDLRMKSIELKRSNQLLSEQIEQARKNSGTRCDG